MCEFCVCAQKSQAKVADQSSLEGLCCKYNSLKCPDFIILNCFGRQHPEKVIDRADRWISIVQLLTLDHDV